MNDVARAETGTGLELTQLEMDRIAAQATAREDLLDNRRACDTGGGDLSICRASIEEAVRREVFMDFYATRSSEDEAISTWQQVFQAARNNVREYLNPVHGESELSCRLAYDAGIGWGYTNPEEPVVPNVSSSEIDAVAQACFAEDSNATPLQGLLAGVRHGQEYYDIVPPVSPQAQLDTKRVPAKQ